MWPGNGKERRGDRWHFKRWRKGQTVKQSIVGEKERRRKEKSQGWAVGFFPSSSVCAAWCSVGESYIGRLRALFSSERNKIIGGPWEEWAEVKFGGVSCFPPVKKSLESTGGARHGWGAGASARTDCRNADHFNFLWWVSASLFRGGENWNVASCTREGGGGQFIKIIIFYMAIVLGLRCVEVLHAFHWDWCQQQKS